MNNKRGQAALEFLTTYGWAFLVILVMIGALAYFGVLDPTRFLPQRCQFGAEMHCGKFALDWDVNDDEEGTDGGAYFELTNALPTHVFITNLTWKDPDGEEWNVCDLNASMDGDNIYDPDDEGVQFSREVSENFVCEDNDMDMVESDKTRVQFRITYNEGTSAEPAYSKVLFGEIYANVRG